MLFMEVATESLLAKACDAIPRAGLRRHDLERFMAGLCPQAQPDDTGVAPTVVTREQIHRESFERADDIQGERAFRNSSIDKGNPDLLRRRAMAAYLGGRLPRHPLKLPASRPGPCAAASLVVES